MFVLHHKCPAQISPEIRSPTSRLLLPPKLSSGGNDEICPVIDSLLKRPERIKNNFEQMEVLVGSRLPNNEQSVRSGGLHLIPATDDSPAAQPRQEV